MIATATFTTAELVEESGCSWRQADYWARTGLLRPCVPATGQGSRRQFDQTEVDVATALNLVVAVICQSDERGTPRAVMEAVAQATREGRAATVIRARGIGAVDISWGP